MYCRHYSCIDRKHDQENQKLWHLEDVKLCKIGSSSFFTFTISPFPVSSPFANETIINANEWRYDSLWKVVARNKTRRTMLPNRHRTTHSHSSRETGWQSAISITRHSTCSVSAEGSGVRKDDTSNGRFVWWVLYYLNCCGCGGEVGVGVGEGLLWYEWV